MDEVKKERLRVLREAQVDLEKAEKEATDERELEALELQAKIVAETKGVRGRDFAIVNNVFGVFAVRKPDAQAIGNWDRARDEDRLSLEWQIALLRNYIFPDKARGIEWAQIASDRPGLVWETANAFLELMGVSKSAVSKKS